jgi:MFS family permease
LSLRKFAEPRWTALWAAMAGYMLDAMDVLLYVFAIQTLKTEFGMSNATAGLASSATLVFSAAGGILAGMLSDRIGRRKTLIWTILTYSLASAGTATAHSIPQLMFWRALVGLGLGGEWSAGATLVAESWPARDRGKAMGLMQSGWAIGYVLAAIAAAVVLPRWGWRILFLVGVLPALATAWIQRYVEEPAVWTQSRQAASWTSLFRPPLARITVLTTSVATAVMFGYWGLFTWLPGFLSAPVAKGGAGLDIVHTSAWIIVMQAGTFSGYLVFGWLADRAGRRPTFALYVIAAALLVPVYGSIPRWAGGSANSWLLVLGPLVGFFGTGYFSLFGAMLAELYPTSVRGSGQGFTYNFGRGLSALAPYAVGAVADRTGLGPALALNSAFFLVASVVIYALPETKNVDLAAA